MIVTADTVLRWQRRRFREYWSKLSGCSTGGRPAVHAEIKTLITRMATANPLWGAPTGRRQPSGMDFGAGQAKRRTKSGVIIGQPEVLQRNAELCTEAPHLVASQALIMWRVGQRRKCPRFGFVTPEIVNTHDATRPCDVDADLSECESVTPTRVLDEISQRRRLGEGRRQQLCGLRLRYADLWRVDDYSAARESLCVEGRRHERDLGSFEPFPKARRRAGDPMKGLEVVL